MSVTIQPDIWALTKHLEGNHEAQECYLNLHFPLEYEVDAEGNATPTGYRVGFPGLNVSNTNFRALWEVLKFTIPFDTCGKYPAKLLFDHVIMALVTLEDDIGTKDVVHNPTGQVTVIECGRPPGYIQERLTQLKKIAIRAMDMEVGIVWS